MAHTNRGMLVTKNNTASGNADASWLAAAALAHAQAGRQGEQGEGGFTPMQVAQNLACLC